jgi:hypothetical protein
MAIRKKTTTVLIEDTRISWFNTNCVHINETDDGFMFTVFWKYKASIKRKNIFTTMKENELPKYFEKYGLVKFQDYFINLGKIMIIDEESIFGPKEKAQVSIVFSDGYSITKVVDATEWSWWKKTYI